MNPVRRLIDSFNYAFEGIMYALKTQRNMKIHFVIALGVLIFSLFFDLNRSEILLLFSTISLVMITEMINTSIEATIDLITDQYHVFAKIAKNVAAGAVLIASLNAVVVAYLIFFHRFDPMAVIVLHRVKQAPVHITFISLFIVILVVIFIKVHLDRGTPLKGGMPSGHAALAGALFMAITFIGENILIATLALMMAFLIFQSRIEGKIHTPLEVTVGGLLGMLITLLIFQVFS